MGAERRGSAAEFPHLRRWLAVGSREEIEAYARRSRRALSFLTAITYDDDALTAWRAVEALGWAASVVAAEDPEYVRVHLRRLMWLLNDESGGIGWRAPEAMGEIIRSAPALFRDFIPILISTLDMEAPEDGEKFRPGALWGIARVAGAAPEACRGAVPHVLGCFEDERALETAAVPALAAWCLRFLPYPGPWGVLEPFREDGRRFGFYWDGMLRDVTVGEVVGWVLEGRIPRE